MGVYKGRHPRCALLQASPLRPLCELSVSASVPKHTSSDSVSVNGARPDPVGVLSAAAGFLSLFPPVNLPLTPLECTVTGKHRDLSGFSRNRQHVSHLDATLTSSLIGVDSKGFMEIISPLDATLTRKPGVGGILPILGIEAPVLGSGDPDQVGTPSPRTTGTLPIFAPPEDHLG